MRVGVCLCVGAYPWVRGCVWVCVGVGVRFGTRVCAYVVGRPPHPHTHKHTDASPLRRTKQELIQQPTCKHNHTAIHEPTQTHTPHPHPHTAQPHIRTHTCIVDVSWLGMWGGIVVCVWVCVGVCVDWFVRAGVCLCVGVYPWVRGCVCGCVGFVVTFGTCFVRMWSGAPHIHTRTNTPTHVRT